MFVRRTFKRVFIALALACACTACTPPASSPATAADLAGADANADGVRDDVAQAITSRYPDDAAKQQALMHMAKALQGAMLAGAAGGQSIVSAAEELSRQIKNLHTHTDTADADIRFLEDTVVDNRERAAAYDRFNTGMSGRFISGNGVEGNT